jgi:hypothetical protein
MGHEKEAVEIAHHLLRMGHRDEPLEIKLKTDKKKGVERAIFYFRALQCRLFEILMTPWNPAPSSSLASTIMVSGPRSWFFVSAIASRSCRRQPFR